MNDDRLDPKLWFGKVIVDALTDMANDYQRIADRLRHIAADVPKIGEPRGMGTVTATGLLTEALVDITRNTPSLVRAVKSVAEFEQHAAGPRPTEEP